MRPRTPRLPKPRAFTARGFFICMVKQLTALQERFVEEFPIDLNGTQAAIRAGYSEKSAAITASKLLSIAKVQDAIKEAKIARSLRTQITADRVLLEVSRLAYAHMGQFAVWNKDEASLVESEELTEDQLAAVSEVSDSRTRRGRQVKIKLHDKGKALELLMRHLGLLVDRHEVDVRVYGKFVIGKGYDD